jgi:hypothetical protein
MQWRALNAEAAQRKHASIPFAALKGSDVRSEAKLPDNHPARPRRNLG